MVKLLLGGVLVFQALLAPLASAQPGTQLGPAPPGATQAAPIGHVAHTTVSATQPVPVTLTGDSRITSENIAGGWQRAHAVAAILGALATVGAVLVALFWPGCRERRNRPVLELRVTNAEPHKQDWELTCPDWTTTAWFMRLEVHNTGKTTAQDVEVIATGLRCYHGQQSVPRPILLPVNLRWSLFPESAKGQHVRLVHIPNHTSRYCDLAVIPRPAFKTLPDGKANAQYQGYKDQVAGLAQDTHAPHLSALKEGDTYVQVRTCIAGGLGDRSDVRVVDDYIVVLHVVAANVEPRVVEVRINARFDTTTDQGWKQGPTLTNLGEWSAKEYPERHV